MTEDRGDVVFIPKVSWTSNDAPSAVSYGALVGTLSTIFLLPRSGAETAGFTLKLQWTRENQLDDIAALVRDPNATVANIESALTEGLGEWSTRCKFPLDQMSRFEIFSGWKLWLGVSAALQVEGESAVGLRIANKGDLANLRALYSGRTTK